MSHAAAKDVLVVRATGNDPTASGGLGRPHAWPVRVVGYDSDGRPTMGAPVARSIGRDGVGAPAFPTLGLGLGGGYQVLRVSVAMDVTAALALLWSTYPDSTAARIRRAVAVAGRGPRVIPPLLDMVAVCAEMERS